MWVLATGYSCALETPPGSALGLALDAATLVIHQRLSLDVEHYANRVDLRVVPPLCPIAIAPTDFSQAEDLINRAYEHTRAWLSQPGTPASAPLFGDHPHHRDVSARRHSGPPRAVPDVLQENTKSHQPATAPT